jgi:hypothetical protein
MGFDMTDHTRGRLILIVHECGMEPAYSLSAFDSLAFS